jgi:transcriptional regulator with XRE-family HTH domain
VERGLSQREIGSRGVSNAYISRIEAGTRTPSVKAIRKLAEKIGVTPEYLERGVDATPREDRELRALRAELALRLDDDAETATQLLGAVAEEAAREGDERTETRARLLLGLAAGRRGAHQQALDQLLPLIKSVRLEPAAYPELYIAASRCLCSLDRQNEAGEFLRSALANVEKLAGPGSALAAAFASELASLLSQSGRGEEATRLLTRTLALAERPREPRERARVFKAQALLANEKNDLRGELEALRKALAMLEASEGTHALAHAHLLYAHMLIEAGSADEALANVEQAESLLAGSQTPSESSRIQRARARAALTHSKPEDAIVLARAALAISGVDDEVERGETHWILAEGLAATGQTAAAETEVGEALALLRSVDAHAAGELLRWWAKVLRRNGRTDEAFAALEDALTLD